MTMLHGGDWTCLSDGQALSEDAIVGRHKCCLLVTDISVAMGI